MTAVRVDLRKWPDRPHRCVDGTLLGEDDFGTWIGVRERAIAYVFLIPRNSWWIGRHFGDGGWKLDMNSPSLPALPPQIWMPRCALTVNRSPPSVRSG